MIIVATIVLAALLRMKREPLLAGRFELRSRTPVASAHTTRSHATTAAVAAGAWIPTAVARSALSSRLLSANRRACLADTPLPVWSGVEPGTRPVRDIGGRADA